MNKQELNKYINDILSNYEEFDDAIRDALHHLDENNPALNNIREDLTDLLIVYMRDGIDLGMQYLLSDVDQYIDKDIENEDN